MLYYNPNEFEMYDFTIGDVKIQVGQPSFLFDVAMKGFDNDKYYESDFYWTISLKGITEENYEEYLTKALFLIGYYNQSTINDEYPECEKFWNVIINKIAEILLCKYCL